MNGAETIFNAVLFIYAGGPLVICGAVLLVAVGVVMAEAAFRGNR